MRTQLSRWLPKILFALCLLLGYRAYQTGRTFTDTVFLTWPGVAGGLLVGVLLPWTVVAPLAMIPHGLSRRPGLIRSVALCGLWLAVGSAVAEFNISRDERSFYREVRARHWQAYRRPRIAAAGEVSLQYRPGRGFTADDNY